MSRPQHCLRKSICCPIVRRYFCCGPSEGAPYLARTALLRRRLRRLLSNRDRVSRVLNLQGVAERIEYWPVGLASRIGADPSGAGAALFSGGLAAHHAPARAGLRAADAGQSVSAHHDYHAIGPRSLLYGPFASRAAADRFNEALLDLFQIRRCEENLAPAPDHPGCIYGEMNRCLRPCQEAVSKEEYRGEAARVEEFLRTGGASLRHTAEAARDRASAAMQFEEAAQLHQRAARIGEVQALAGELARSLDVLAGVAVTPSAAAEAVDLWFLAGGRWQEPRRVMLSETAGAGQSLDRRMREIASGIAPPVDTIGRRAQSGASGDPGSLVWVELARRRMDRLRIVRETAVS